MSRHPLTRRGPRAGIVVVAAAALVAALLPVADLRAAPAPEAEARAAAPAEAEVGLVVGYEQDTSGADRSAVVSDVTDGTDVDVTADTGSEDATNEALAAIDAEVVRVAASDVDEVATDLRADPRVAYVDEPVEGTLDAVTRVPPDPLWGDMATHWHTGLPEAWARGTGVEDVTIAVLDNAFDVAHTDLRPALAPGRDVVTGGSVAGSPTCDLAQRPGCRDTRDEPAHGTMSSLTAGAVADNGFGGAGVCWRCTLLPVKIADQAGDIYDTNVAAGVLHAVAQGADVISMSLSFKDQTGTTFRNALLEADAAGVLVVASAGNAGNSRPRWPGIYPEVLAVAGTRPDAQDTIAHGSSRGADWVSVAAPYEHTVSARTGGPVYFSGTSSSAPVVAGIAALLKSADPSLDGAALRSVIEQTAVPLAGNAVEHGRVDAASALEQVMGQTYTTAVLPLEPADVTAGTGFGNGEIDVVWRQPVDGPAVDSFTVTATPGGQSVTVGPSARGATLSGLTVDVAHTVTVVAQNDAGGSSPGTSAPAYPGGSDETTMPPPPPGCECEDDPPPEQPVPGGPRHPVYGDWDGDGLDTPGWFTGGRWYLRNDYESGGAQVVVAYGAQPADRPVVGDWDGDGRDGIGIKRGSEYHLRNVAGAGGRTDHQFSFGFAGDAAVAGDWDHDGRDTIALKRGSVWYLRDSSDPAVRTYSTTRLGAASDVAVAGDWDGDGRDTLGVFRNGIWYRLVRNDGGGPTRFHPLVSYGVSPGDRPLAGAYRVGGADALVIVRGSTWHLRHETSGTTWRQVAF